MDTQQSNQDEKFKVIKEAISRYCKKKGYEFNASDNLLTVKEGKDVVCIHYDLTIIGTMWLCCHVRIEAEKALRCMDKCDECISSGGICGHITRDDSFFLDCDELTDFRNNDYV